MSTAKDNILNRISLEKHNMHFNQLFLMLDRAKVLELALEEALHSTSDEKHKQQGVDEKILTKNLAIINLIVDDIGLNNTNKTRGRAKLELGKLLFNPPIEEKDIKCGECGCNMIVPQLETDLVCQNLTCDNVIFTDDKEENKLITEIEKYSNKYQFSFQFWGEDNNNIYIMKDDVDLYDTGGHSTVKDVLIAALHYIYKINRVPYTKRIC